MNLYIKKILFMLTIGIVCFNMYAFDFGGSITNTTGIKITESTGITQNNIVSGWVKQHFSKSNSHYITAEGSYNFSGTFAISNTAQDPLLNNYINLDLLKYTNKFILSAKNMLKLDIGRFIISDITGNIFSQPADGVSLTASLSNMQFSAYSGYTGLLNGKTVSMVSPYDAEQLDSLYPLAHPYIVGKLNAKFPSLFLNQTLSVETLGFFDLKSAQYNREYVTAALNGMILPTLYYTASTTLAFEQKAQDQADSFKIGNLTLLECTFFPGFYSSTIGFNAAFATAQTTEIFGAFNSCSVSSAVQGASVPYTNILKAGLNASIKPISNLLISASPQVLFAVVNTDEQKAGYKGFGWSLSATYVPLSDISLTAFAAHYIPSKDTQSFTANIKLVIAF